MIPYQDHIDTELVALLANGDQKAFEQIYRRYASCLYGFARKTIPLREDCEEIVQEIFESLWARRKSLGDIEMLRAYLFRTVKYRIIRYIQHRQVKKKYAEHFMLFEAIYDDVGEEERDPAALQSLMEKAILQLPERCREAMKLRLRENLSNGDIAKRMKISKKTVEAYMFNAFNHFRQRRHELIG